MEVEAAHCPSSAVREASRRIQGTPMGLPRKLPPTVGTTENQRGADGPAQGAGNWELGGQNMTFRAPQCKVTTEAQTCVSFTDSPAVQASGGQAGAPSRLTLQAFNRCPLCVSRDKESNILYYLFPKTCVPLADQRWQPDPHRVWNGKCPPVTEAPKPAPWSRAGPLHFPFSFLLGFSNPNSFLGGTRKCLEMRQ